MVNGKPITTADVDARIAEIPRLARPDYSGPVGRERMLRKMIEERVLYLAAMDAGVDRDEDVQRRIEAMRRETIVQTYLDRMQEKASQVDEDEARAFYEAHEDEYRTEKMVRVRMLLTENETVARRAYEMVTEGGASFEDLCTKFSDNPFVVSARGLIPTWIRKGHAVPWIGNRVGFDDVVFSLEPGELSEPFQTDAGWHIVRVEDVREARQRPFEEVEKDVVGRISTERSTRGLPELLAELDERYDVQVFTAPDQRSADELFAEAQAAQGASERVALYDELVHRFPDYEHAIDAHFMIGFIRAEELHDPDGARESFRKVIALDPDSDLAQSARWMLTSGDVDPDFEDDGRTPDPQEAAP
jgi:peptidyl-prolyl cis-trans isomerase C